MTEIEDRVERRLNRLEDRMEARFNRLDGKVDRLNLKVARQAALVSLITTALVLVTPQVVT